MTRVFRRLWILGAALLFPAVSTAQTASGSQAPTPWSFDVSAGTYVLPEDANYVQPTFTADRGSLHLTSRFNYEDRNTVSLFAGRNFTFGEKRTLEITPMIGGVFGRTSGIAPGLGLTLSAGPFELSSESEYLIDLGDSSSSFFYSWSELGVQAKWLRAGAAVQRTRVFHMPREVAAGPLVGVSFGKMSATLYAFDPGGEEGFSVILLSLSF